jgi:hypothetical protein
MKTNGKWGDQITTQLTTGAAQRLGHHPLLNNIFIAFQNDQIQSSTTSACYGSCRLA